MKAPYWIDNDLCIDLLEPKAETIFLDDIARALSNNNRFGGHTEAGYSVAAHSLLVASLLPEDLKLVGLLHDASEGYLNDVIYPLKMLLPKYRDIELAFQCAIAYRFGLEIEAFSDARLREADRLAAVAEAQHIIGLDTDTKWEGYPKNVVTADEMRGYTSYGPLYYRRRWILEVTARLPSEHHHFRRTTEDDR